MRSHIAAPPAALFKHARRPARPGFDAWTRCPSDDTARYLTLSVCQHLTAAHGCGILVISLLLAGVFQSWAVFLIVAVLLRLAAVDNGEIRPGPRRR